MTNQSATGSPATSGDLAGERFWQTFWSRPAGRSFSTFSYSYRAFLKLLRQYIQRGSRVCEVGCGASVWLPALALEGADAWGIDYSPVGVELAKRQAVRFGVTTTIVHGNVFDASALPAGSFDVVFSLGLLEHFEDSKPLVQRFRDLCKPGGHVITLVPNFAGVWGAVQKRVDPVIYNTHMIYTPIDLDAAHAAVGLVPTQKAQYSGGISPLVVNYSGVLGRFPPPVSKALFLALWFFQQSVCWGTAALPSQFRNPPRWAAHVTGVYQRPA